LQGPEPDPLLRLNVEFEATGVQVVRHEVEIGVYDVGQLYDERARFSEAPVAGEAARVEQVAGRPVVSIEGVSAVRTRVGSLMFSPWHAARF
jgi:hypothetical protein